MSDDKKFYWLKLKRDFFKRHDVQIIEGMPNGKDYLLFYLKLMCESIDHNGNLRFSDTIPYNEQMLATITNTNVDIVRSALKLFTELKMVDVLDDQTIYMTEVQKLIGCAVDNPNANRQRRYRERQKELEIQGRYEGVTENNESKSKSIDIDTDIDIERDNITTTTINNQSFLEMGAFVTEEQMDNYEIDETHRKAYVAFCKTVWRIFRELGYPTGDSDGFVRYNRQRGWRGLGGELIVKDESTLTYYIEKWCKREPNSIYTERSIWI